ncbi:MAG: phage portal protein [Actinomycetota bacterium]|nr:phage portal protein [Actinomycetota bacterium]
MPETIVWSGTTADFPPNLELLGRWATYAEIFRKQLWVYVVVSKLAKATARLPLKVYRHDELNRPEARDDPYARLLRRPNSKHSPFYLWNWVSSTFDVYGEAFITKVRDNGGRPAELLPVHPTAMKVVEETDAGIVWRYESGSVRIDRIPPEDVVHFRSYNPSSLQRGLSPLEPLRATLENEDAARRASSAFWKHGGRPSVVLRHPRTLSDQAAERLRLDWESIHGGVDNFGKAAILEEGVEAQELTLTAEEAQYIGSRKLNREEVAAAYDVPPPVIGILDRATFSNITAQLRSLYRDTMAPRLALFESELDLQLREPDFSEDVYAEFLMDEVLRGDFEQRLDVLDRASFLTLAEKRKLENLPYIEGTDVLLVNTAEVPFGQSWLERGEEAPLDERSLRTVMGRLGRAKALEEVNPGALAYGLNGGRHVVFAEYEASRSEGATVEQFKERLKALTRGA